MNSSIYRQRYVFFSLFSSLALCSSSLLSDRMRREAAAEGGVATACSNQSRRRRGGRPRRRRIHGDFRVHSGRDAEHQLRWVAEDWRKPFEHIYLWAEICVLFSFFLLLSARCRFGQIACAGKRPQTEAWPRPARTKAGGGKEAGGGGAVSTATSKSQLHHFRNQHRYAWP